MRVKTWLLVVIAGVVLAGCSKVTQILQILQISTAPEQDCSSAQCSLNVTVDDCVVNVDDLNVSKAPPNTDLLITWTITTPGYVFSQDQLAYAISLKSGNPHSAFHNPTVNNNTLTVQFKHGASGKHKHQYGLNVVKDATACRTADPFIYE